LADAIDDNPDFEPAPLNVLGLTPRLRVEFVVEDSPAAEAGVRPGDVIVSLGEPAVTPTLEKLRDVLDQYAGQPAPMRVLRDGEIVSLQVGSQSRQENRQMGVLTGFETARAVVAEAISDSPTEGQVPPGAEITAVIGPGDQTTEIGDWGELIVALAGRASEPVVLEFRRPDGEMGRTDPIAPVEAGFDAGDYVFEIPLQREVLMTEPRQTWNPLTAAWWGVQETSDFVLQGYMTISALITGKVDPSNVSGPVGIFRAGMQVSEHRGVKALAALFGMISALLAVFNFLPLPILDGGHAVLLLIERVRGKPVSMKVQNIIQMIGLAAFIGLFLLITYNDIVQWVRDAW
jgi:regulator of sigma E protease